MMKQIKKIPENEIEIIKLSPERNLIISLRFAFFFFLFFPAAVSLQTISQLIVNAFKGERKINWCN